MNRRDVLFFVAGAAVGALLVVLLNGIEPKDEKGPLPPSTPLVPIRAPESVARATPEPRESIEEPVLDAEGVRRRLATLLDQGRYGAFMHEFDRARLDDDSLIPDFVELARRLLEEAESPLSALNLLARMGTPAAHIALADLFADPAFADPQTACFFALPLLEVRDPRIGPVSIERFRDCEEEGMTSWVHMRPMTILLARHGGANGVEILESVIRRRRGQASSCALEALRYGRDERLLDIALNALRREAHHDRDMRWVPGLVDGYGESAVSGLLALATDQTAPLISRAVAAESLATKVGAEQVPGLLVFRPSNEEGLIFIGVAHQLARRRDLELTKDQVTLLREGVLELIRTENHPARRSACYALEYCELYQTEEMVSAVEAVLAAETEKYWRNSMKDALRDARRTMKRNSR